MQNLNKLRDISFVHISIGHDTMTPFRSQVVDFCCAIRETNDIYPIVIRNWKSVKSRAYFDFEYATLYGLPIYSKSVYKIYARILAGRVLRKIKRHELCYFHCRGERAVNLGYELKRTIENSIKTKIIILYDVRGATIDEMSEAKGIKTKIKNRLVTRDFYMARNLADMYMYITTNLKNHLQNKHGFPRDRNIVFPSYVCKENVGGEHYKHSYSDGLSNIRLLYVGGIEDWQGVENIGKIVNYFCRYSSVTLVLVSKTEENANKILSSIDASDNYRYEIKIDLERKKIFRQIMISDICLLPRNQSVVNYVSSPTKVSEYLIYGNMLLTTAKIGVLEDFGSDKVIYFPVEEIDLDNSMLFDLMIQKSKQQKSGRYFKGMEYNFSINRYLEQLIP